jgi:hypothetical protein
MPEPTIQTATTAAGLIEKAVKWTRRPFVWLACKVAGIDAALEHSRIEGQREREREIREAVGNLEQALATGIRYGTEVGIQLNQAISVIERRWPDLHQRMQTLIYVADQGEPPSIQQQRQLMRPFVERLGRELGEG